MRTPGNPYDGHTLQEALEQVKILTDQRPDRRRPRIPRSWRATRPDQRQPPRTDANLIADLRRRSAIEPEIGHMKTDGRLSRCPLKGTIGDALFACLRLRHNMQDSGPPQGLVSGLSPPYGLP